jgi:hypothetical protein
MTEERQSLVPADAGSDVLRGRLQGDAVGYDAMLRVAMVWWREVNTPQLMINFGAVPLDSIAHKCTGACTDEKRALLFGASRHDFTRPIPPDVVNATTGLVQWLFGTSVGLSELDRLLGKLGYSREPIKQSTIK